MGLLLIQTMRSMVQLVGVKRILIICFSHVENDPRVLKQIYWTKDDYRVTVAGFGDLSLNGVEFVRIEEPRTFLLEKTLRRLYMLFGSYENYYWSLPFVIDAYKKLKGRKFDIIRK